MKKIPLELVTTLVQAKSFSPVIWDGYDLIVSQNDDHNIQQLANKVATLVTKSAAAEAQLNNQRQDFNRINPEVSMLMQAYPDVQNRMSGIETAINGSSGVLNRVTTVETRVANIESDVNSLVSGGAGGGGGLSTTYTNILAALNNGSYLVGGADMSVEKLTSGSNAGSYRINFTGNTEQTTVASANNYIVVTSTGRNYTIEFNTAELINYIGAAKGLQVDSAYSNKIVITPKSTLVRGDGSTIDVSFDAVSGQFTVSSLQSGGSGGGSSAVVDNKTILSNNGVLSTNPEAVNANLHPFSYESANFYGSTEVDSLRLSQFTETTIYNSLPQDKLANVNAVASSNLSQALKLGVFNTAATTMLAGSYYLLNDFNSVGSVVTYPMAAQSINSASIGKTFKLDVDIAVRLEYVNSPTIRYGNTFQLTERNLIIPFYLYWVTNSSKNTTVLVGGEILKFASPTGDGFGALASHRASHIINAASLASNNLDAGILQTHLIVGFKVAAVSDTIFLSAILNKYLVEPKFNALATYL